MIGDRLIANQDRDSLQLGRNICPNPPQLKPSYDKGMLMETDERPRTPLIQPPCCPLLPPGWEEEEKPRAPLIHLIQPPPPHCPLLPPGWKALAARAPASPYPVPFLLSPSGKRFFSVGEAVGHLVNPPKIEQKNLEMPMIDRRRTRKMLTKRHPRTSLRRKALMKNTERRVLAEVGTTGHLWDPHSLPLELDMDPRDLPPELNLDSSDLRNYLPDLDKKRQP